MKTKHRLTALVLIFLMLFASSCQDMSTVAEGETGDTSAESVSDTETAAPEPVSVTLTAHTLTLDNGKIALDMTADVEAEAKVTVKLTLSDADGVIDEAVFDAAGDTTVLFDCPEEKLQSELEIYGTAVSEGKDLLDELFLKLKGGLPQLTEDGVSCVVAAMTDREKSLLVTGTPNPVKPGASGGTYAIERFGIPSVTVNDGPAGVRYSTSVWYPSVHNISASWDSELISSVGEAIGKDALALGIDIVLAPGMNIQKNVLNGRNFEYCSEDPILTAAVSSAYVKGMQSSGAGACVKHYAANNQETARGTTSANVTERALREIYLKAFGIVVNDASPFTVMSSYNRLNGEYTSIRSDLLTGVLRDEFSFEGFVMSDWGSAGSVCEKVMAGNDLNMPGNAGDPGEIMSALKTGRVTMEALDTACENILSIVVKSATYLGLEMNTRINLSAHSKLAVSTAAETIILLKNDNSALPLAEGSSIAVFGNGAYKTVFGGAGSGGVTASRKTTVFDGIRKSDVFTAYNDVSDNPFRSCDHHDSLDPSKDVPVTEKYASEMANGADTALIVISRGSTEGSDRSSLEGDFNLNATEREMIENVSEAFRAKGKKVIAVLNMGSPIEVESWKDKVDSILYLGYAGQGSGEALVKVLSGEVNPAAKTTISWPVSYDSTPAYEHFPGNAAGVTYYEDIYVGYRYYSTFDVPVSYPFGYGLSYTSFSYGDLTVERSADGTVTAKVTVTNTGSVAGREIVQLYVSKPETLQEQAELELAAFAKTKLLQPGDSETLTLTVTNEALMTYDTEGSRWVLDSGEYTFSVGSSAKDLYGEAKLDIASLLVVKDVENRCAPSKEIERIEKDSYVIPDPETRAKNIALNCKTSSNYDENEITVSQLAVDGSFTTRWSGLGLASGDHFWQVDLGKTYSVGRVRIMWESIHAPYTIFTSLDGKDFSIFKTYIDDGSMSSDINLYGTEARFIRVSIPRGNAVSIFEFSAFEATEADVEEGKDVLDRTNIATGKPVSSTTHEGAYVDENAVDGDISTRWGSLPRGEAWIEVDLEAVRKINGIGASLEAAWVPYRIEYSTDGENYTKIFAGSKDQLTVDIRDLDIEARYIRFIREGESWFSIYEIYVYEK